MKLQTANGQVGMSIVINGRAVEEYPHGGKTYLWARHGTEYSIQTWNYTDRRVEMVITVDGLDIIAGRLGDYRTQKGYVVEANSKPQPIPGFRLDGGNAAKFVFTAPGGSYAALTERPANIGVIGAAVFFERKRLIDLGLGLESRGGRPETFGGMRGGDSPMRGGDVSKGGGPSVGTGFGRQTSFQTGSTNFDRENPTTPDGILVLNYETRERLMELGINVDQPPVVANSPSPFPGVSDGCTPPPGWNPGRRG